MPQHTDAPTALKVALLGGGTVGSQTARILTEDADILRDRVGADLELTGIAVRDTGATRDWQADPALYTTDAEALVDGADVVIELMGGIEPARTLILRALAAGTSVVTGNKALLAQHGEELYAAAAATGAQLSFEAAVAGAIPILRPLRDSLGGDRVTRVMGIANGTTNFILDRMDSEGADFDDALAEAQRLGYAEADPTADVEGHDAAAKAAILATIAFGAPYTLDQVAVAGITAITAEDNAAAAEAGYVIKLLAIAERGRAADGAQGAVLRVHPTLLPREHPLASVRGAFNAVFVEAENAGELMFYGRGAGGDPTASAVLGDIVHAARHRVSGPHAAGESAYATLPILPIGESLTRYVVRVEVADEPGVLGRVTSAFGDQGVSIESMRQGVRRSEDGLASLTFMTHEAPESALATTVDTIKKLPDVTSVTSVLRAEGI